MKISAIYIVLMSAFIMIGCEKEVTNIELPNAEPQLVVYSYISPSDSLITVQVTKSIPYFGSTDNSDGLTPIADAKVTLSTMSGLSIELPYDAQYGKYRISNSGNISIQAGQTYMLAVSAPGGFACNARTTVPNSQPNNVQVQIDSTIRSYDGYQDKEYRIIGTWLDQSGVDNYYHTSFRIIPDPNRSNSGFSLCSDYISDSNKNGEVLSTSCTYTSFYNPINPTADPIYGQFFVLSTDFSYYKFHESLARYDGENPFSEPTQIYSNVDGGLGCFGSYLRNSVSF